MQVAFNATDGSGTGNLPTGQTLEQTFACIADVGAAGCGLEHVLESTSSTPA